MNSYDEYSEKIKNEEYIMLEDEHGNFVTIDLCWGSKSISVATGYNNTIRHEFEYHPTDEQKKRLQKVKTIEEYENWLEYDYINSKYLR